MIVDQIDVADLSVVEGKNDTPVAIDTDGPEPSEIVAQGMEPIAWQSHLIDRLYDIEALQDALDLGQHIGSDPGSIALLIEALESPMAEASDHTHTDTLTIVTCQS
jgi:hypothetical protein